MPLTLLDFLLIGIMLLSGVLALMRGFTREVLSLFAWGIAAVAAYFAIKQPKLIDVAMKNVPYLEKEMLAQIAVGAVVFLIVLIIVSIISVKISDLVVDSSAGGFDRTLGFFFGLARGFVFVTICYLFYGWLQPPEKQVTWVRNAMSLPAIMGLGNTMKAYMPADIADTLSNTALLKNPEMLDGAAPADQPEGAGYKSDDNQRLEDLSKGLDGEQQPAFGQNPNP